MSEEQLQRDVLEVTGHLVTALRLTRLHEGVHNVVFADPLARLRESLAGLIERCHEFHLQVDEGLLYFNKRLLRGGEDGRTWERLDGLRDELSRLGLAGMWIGRALDAQEIERVLLLLQRAARESGQAAPGTLLAGWLVEWGLQAKVRFPLAGEGGGTAVARRIEIDPATYFPLAYARLLVLVRDWRQHAGEPELSRYFGGKLHRAVDELAALVPRWPQRFLAMASARAPFDPVTRHAVSTGLLSLLIGHRLGLPRASMADLALSGTLGLLSEAERGAAEEPSAARRRPYRALSLLLSAEELSPRLLAAAAVTLQAPTPAARRRVPEATSHPFARIVRSCAAYDAAVFPLEEGQTPQAPDQALHDLFTSGRHDRTVLLTLANTLGVFPVGTAVRLRTGELAVVVHNNPGYPGRPLVAIAREPNGEDGGGRLLDLAEKDLGGTFRSEIAAAADAAAEGIDPQAYLL